MARSDKKGVFSSTRNFRLIEDSLQCNVASEGNGADDVVVVRSELAPFSSSVLMFFSQKEKNLASVFSGFAFATHSTSW